MKKRVTIQAVADKAGVSRGTVDRVLNNRAHVNPEIKQKVLQAIEETGYLSPKQIHSQSIAISAPEPSLKIGVLLPNWTGHFKTEILRGIGDAQKEVGTDIEIFIKECISDISQEAVSLLDELLDKGIQALAICTQNTPTIKQKVDEIIGQGIPVITFNSDIPNSNRLCFIGQDHHKSGRIAAELISKCIPRNGRILTAVGFYSFDGHMARLSGFQERLSELGFTKDRISVIETFNDYTTTYNKILSYLQSGERVDAIYMANRSVAACAEALKALGLEKDIKVICHDIAANTKLLLEDGSIDFTITQNIYRQGYLPIMYLKDYLKDKTLPDSTSISPHISIVCSQNL